MTRRKGPADEHAEERAEMGYYYKTHPEERKREPQYQYSAPLGPEPRQVNAKQYAQPIGPKQVNPEQYRSPAGPSHPHAGSDSNQYQYPIGPEKREVNPKQYKQPIGPENPRAGVNPTQYSKPIGPQQQSTFDRMRGIGGATYEAGAHARSVGHEIGQSPYIRAIASQSGFTQSSRGPRRTQPTYPVGYQEDQPSPRETIRLTICDEYGNCRTKTIKGGNPRKQRPSRGAWAVGGLGGHDPGFL